MPESATYRTTIVIYYHFISYEIDNLPEGFQIIDDFNINENEILNLGSINVIEKTDSTQNLQEFNREEKLLEKCLIKICLKTAKKRLRI